jgi:hypothetical protein
LRKEGLSVRGWLSQCHQCVLQAIKFPPEMRAALPQGLQSSLFDWRAPTPEEAEQVMRERIARM